MTRYGIPAGTGDAEGAGRGESHASHQTGAQRAPAPDTRPCIFLGCVSRERHWHGGFPGGYEDPTDPDGPPVPFTAEPAPGVRDYNGAILPAPDQHADECPECARYEAAMRRVLRGPEVDAVIAELRKGECE